LATYYPESVIVWGNLLSCTLKTGELASNPPSPTRTRAAITGVAAKLMADYQRRRRRRNIWEGDTPSPITNH